MAPVPEPSESLKDHPPPSAERNISHQQQHQAGSSSVHPERKISQVLRKISQAGSVPERKISHQHQQHVTEGVHPERKISEVLRKISQAGSIPERKISHQHQHGTGGVQPERKISEVLRKISQAGSVPERKISHGKGPCAVVVVSSPERKISHTRSDNANIRERKISSASTIRAWEAEGLEIPPHHQHPNTPPSQSDLERNFDEQMYDHDHPIENVRKSTQFLSALAANMGAFALGTVLAWSATGLPSLRSSGDLGVMSKTEEAWIGSIVTLAALVSCPVAAYAMVTFGRRRSMMLLTGPFIFGWLCIAFADVLPTFLPKVYTIYFGRILTGFCGGCFSVISPVFIAETSHDNLRGALASGFDLMLSAGMLYVYAIGAFTSWKIQALTCGLIPIVCHALLFFVSESPRFLVEQGQLTEASNAISWLFGFKGEILTGEVSVITNSVDESNAKPVNFDRVVMKLSVLKPILICTAIMFFYTMCVYDAVIFYTVDIFKSTGSSLDPKDSAIILGIVGVVASIPAPILVEKAGRRVLLLLSETMLAFSLAALGAFFYITSEDTDDNALHKQFGWIPLSALVVFLVGFSVGVGPLSLLLVGELVPPHIKGLVTCGALMVRWLLAFAVTNSFEAIQSALGLDTTYWMFATICALGVVFVWFCVPETKGKSLDDIQIGFISKAKLRALAAANNNSLSTVEGKSHP